MKVNRIPRKMKKEMKKKTGLIRKVGFIKDVIEWELAKNGLTTEDIESAELISPSYLKIVLKDAIHCVYFKIEVQECE